MIGNKNIFIHNTDNISVELQGAFDVAKVESSDKILAFIKKIREEFFLEKKNDQNKIDDSEIWSIIENLSEDFFKLLKNGDDKKIEKYLSNLFLTPITHGVLSHAYFHCEINKINVNEDKVARDYVLTEIHDKLCALAEFLGCVSVENPEQGIYGQLINTSPRELINKIEDKIGEIKVPKFQGGLYGLVTHRGLFSFRQIAALYTALRVRDLIPNKKSKIVEIGGGTGYVAYYCYLMGYRNYTIIDLPYINIMQAYFLKKNLPDASIKTIGDKNWHKDKTSIKVLPQRCFDKVSKQKIDLLINIDSFPEIQENSAKDYIKKMQKKTRAFLSINQEAESSNRTKQGDVQKKVIDYMSETDKFKINYRCPFWLRKGYVEEYYTTK